MTMNLLEDWCRGMDRDIHRSLLVTGVPVDCGQQEIEETLNGVLSPLGPYLVLNKFFVRQQNAKAVLVEVGEGVNLSTVPREFPGRGGVWRVVCREPTQNAEFLKNLSEFLECEGRTWEDVVRLLQLNHPPPPQNQSQRPENWADALGMLLGAVVQMIYTAAEVHSQEEAQAQQAAEAQALAASANSAGVKVKKEPGHSAEEGSALKENLHSLDDLEAEGDSPKPLVHKAGTSICPGRKKQKNNPQQEAVPWKKPKDDHSSSSASLGDPKADDAESVEISECISSHRKPCMKQEESALKTRVAKSAGKAPSHPTQDAQSEAESPGVACESTQDGAQEGPPKKKAMGWPSARSPASLRKKKKVSLGPVSYVLVDAEDTKKQPATAKKSHCSRRGGSIHEAWRSPPPPESTASTSQGHKAKPEGSSQGSKGFTLEILKTLEKSHVGGWFPWGFLPSPDCLILWSVPDICKDVDLDVLVEALKPVGTFKKIGKVFRREEDSTVGMLQIGEDVDYLLIPREVRLAGGVWRVISKPATKEAEFRERLTQFLEEEGRTLEDVARIIEKSTPHPPQPPKKPKEPRVRRRVQQVETPPPRLIVGTYDSSNASDSEFSDFETSRGRGAKGRGGAGRGRRPRKMPVSYLGSKFLGSDVESEDDEELVEAFLRRGEKKPSVQPVRRRGVPLPVPMFEDSLAPQLSKADRWREYVSQVSWGKLKRRVKGWAPRSSPAVGENRPAPAAVEREGASLSGGANPQNNAGNGVDGRAPEHPPRRWRPKINWASFRRRRKEEAASLAQGADVPADPGAEAVDNQRAEPADNQRAEPVDNQRAEAMAVQGAEAADNHRVEAVADQGVLDPTVQRAEPTDNQREEAIAVQGAEAVDSQRVEAVADQGTETPAVQRAEPVDDQGTETPAVQRPEPVADQGTETPAVQRPEPADNRRAGASAVEGEAAVEGGAAVSDGTAAVTDRGAGAASDQRAEAPAVQEAEASAAQGVPRATPGARARKQVKTVRFQTPGRFSWFHKRRRAFWHTPRVPALPRRAPRAGEARSLRVLRAEARAEVEQGEQEDPL